MKVGFFPSIARLSARVLLILAACAAARVLAEAPRRVVSLSPNITESIFALHGEQQLVGVTDFCFYPAQARNIMHCGGWSNPNYEVLSSLKPDLILVLGEHLKIQEFGRARGIPVHAIKMDGFETIQSGLMRIGELIGRQDEATSLTASIQSQLASIKNELAQDARSKNQPRVFISIERKPGSLNGIYSAGAGSFLDNALSLAGGHNILNDVTNPYPQISKESLIARHPDVILEMTTLEQLTPAEREQLMNDWNLMGSIPAVKNSRIHILTENYLLIPGPRLPQVVRVIKNALYGSR